ncbi:MAG: glycosyltransferase [Staphylococcus equorum]|nr:glycosyltransferase [Staphylococcus equorum]
MKKIMFFIPYLLGGGAERVVVNLLKGLDKSKFDIKLVVIDEKGPFLNEVPKEVEIIELSTNRTLTALFPLARVIRSYEPELLISHLDYANVISVLACKLFNRKTKIFVTEHLNYSASKSSHKLSSSVLKKLMSITYKYADCIVTVSKGITNDLIKILNYSKYSDKFTTVYNPIVLEEEKNSIKEVHWFEENKFKVLGAGRLTAQKDFPTLIKAFAIVKEELPNARLVIIGEGEERENLEKQIQNLNLSECVSLPGFVDNPHYNMKVADLFVLSSKWEGFGNVIVEAMAEKTAVISTDCPSGPNEIIDNNINGVLCKPGDAESLAKAILSLAKDDQLRNKIALKGYERSQDFKVQKIAKEYESLILDYCK